MADETRNTSVEVIPPRKQNHDCTRPGCGRKATCTPVLVVPAHPLALNKQFEGVRSVLWLPLCDKHFGAATVREFMSGEILQGVEQSITADFRANNSAPDFKRAVFQKLAKDSAEFMHYEQLQHEIQVEGAAPALVN